MILALCILACAAVALVAGLCERGWAGVLQALQQQIESEGV